MKNKTKSFSIVELMVIMVILGILSAVAVPIYKVHVTKARVVKAYPIMENLRRKIIEYYELNGAWPPSITFEGVTLNAGDWATINVNPIKNINYSPYDKRVMVQAALSSLNGIPTFGEPGTLYGTASVLRTVFFQLDGRYITVCGLADAVYDVPSKYLPPNCNCNNIIDILYENTNACVQ